MIVAHVVALHILLLKNIFTTVLQRALRELRIYII